MGIKLETGSPGVGLREGYGDLINAAPFVNSYNASIRAGQQLQNFGGQLGDLAVAEQKVYNATQTDLLNIERKTKMNDFLHRARSSPTREVAYLEDDYKRGFHLINKEIIKKAPNDRIKSLVAAEGNNYFASNFPSIQKEARVHRLNGQKTELQERIRDLEIQSVTEENPLVKLELQGDIDKLYNVGLTGGLLLSSEVAKGRNDFLKRQEHARLTRELSQATSTQEVDLALSKVQYMDDPQALVLLELRGYAWVRAKDRANIAAQTKAEELAAKQLKARQDAFERDITVRLYADEEARVRDFGEDSKVTTQELIDKEFSGDIKTSFFNRVVEQISEGYVFKDRQTVPSELERVGELVEEQLRNPYREIITDADIELNDLLSNKHRTLKQTRLNTGKRTEADSVQQTFRKKLKDGLQIERFMKVGIDVDISDKIRTLTEFDARTIPELGGKDNPIDVYNEMMADELKIKTPTHQFNKLRLQGLKDRILLRFQVFADGIDKDTGDVPNVAAMKARINAAVNDKSLDRDDASDMVVALKQMENIGWTATASEKYGGIKSKKTLNIEKKEANQKEAEAQRLAKEKHAAELKQQEEDRLREEERIAKEKDDAEKAAQHQKDMEARKVVEQQEREKLEGEQAQREVDKQMRQSLSQVGEIAKSFNIDPDKLIQSLEPLINELGGVLFAGEDPFNLGEHAEAQKQDKKRIAKLTGQGQQATAQVEKEVARLGESTGKQERLAVASSEAKVLAKRAKEKQSSDARKVATEKQREKNLAEQAKTGLEDKKKYPDKKLLKRLSDLQFRNIDEKLSSIETKEMETIEKEIKNRKLTPLPLG